MAVAVIAAAAVAAAVAVAVAGWPWPSKLARMAAKLTETSNRHIWRSCFTAASVSAVSKKPHPLKWP